MGVKHHVVQSISCGTRFAREFLAMRLSVKNRRLKVGDDTQHLYTPVFKANLWKLKTDGDKMNEDDWVLREEWVAANGSLVYWSKKEGRELVYYMGHDLQKATITKIPSDDCAKPFTFQVQLAAFDDVEFV